MKDKGTVSGSDLAQEVAAKFAQDVNRIQDSLIAVSKRLDSMSQVTNGSSSGRDPSDHSSFRESNRWHSFGSDCRMELLSVTKASNKYAVSFSIANTGNVWKRFGYRGDLNCGGERMTIISTSIAGNRGVNGESAEIASQSSVLAKLEFQDCDDDSHELLVYANDEREPWTIRQELLNRMSQ